MTSQDYWEKKILTWEKKRYSWLALFLPTAWSLRKRLSIAKRWIEERVREKPGASVTDLGCGSGLLAKRLNYKLQFFYVGIDFSEAAIYTAKQRKFPAQFRFISNSVEKVLPFQTDFCVALGLTDWLDPKTLEHLFAEIRCNDILISYTSSTESTSFKLYNLYRRLYDAKKIPARSFTDEEFQKIYSRHGWKLQEDLSNPWTSPGKILWLRNTILT